MNPYILVLHCENADSEKTARELVEKHARALKLKSKTVLPDAVELNWEIRLKSDESSFVNELSSTPGVKHAARVSYNGDYMG